MNTDSTTTSPLEPASTEQVLRLEKRVRRLKYWNIALSLLLLLVTANILVFDLVIAWSVITVKEVVDNVKEKVGQAKEKVDQAKEKVDQAKETVGHAKEKVGNTKEAPNP